MNAYTDTNTDPTMNHNEYEIQEDCNEIPGWVRWLWWATMFLMPAAAGLITGLLENGWLPETFRIMLNDAEEVEAEKAEKAEKAE